MFRGLAIAALFVVPVPGALAQCPATATWRTLVGGSNLSPVGVHPLQTRSFVSSPTTRRVEALDDEAGTFAVAYSAPSLGAGVESYPMVVRLSNGTWRVFVAARDGRVYAIDAGTGMVLWSRDLRRPTCSADTLTAPPAIVLRSVCASYAACAMPAGASGPDTDIVVVGTRFACGTFGSETSSNAVVALRADTGFPVWIFNLTRTDRVDYISEGAALDYSRNRIYVGTGRRVSVDNSLFALAITTGAKLWARNVGRIETTPKLSYNATLTSRLYVATLQGTVRAVRPDNGADVWSPATVSVGGPVSVNLGYRGQSTAIGDRLFAVAPLSGTVSAIRDNGGSATLLWTLTPSGHFGGALAKSAPAIYESSTTGVRALYVGMSDGTVRQIRPPEAATALGATITSRLVDPGGGIVGDALVDLSSAFGSPRLMVGDNAGYVSRWCIPW